MRHCRGCTHPAICDSHGCGNEQSKYEAARKEAANKKSSEDEALRIDGLRYREHLKRGRNEV